MKKIIYILFISIMLQSCGGHCNYSEVIITKNIDGVKIQENTATDCYTVEKNGEGLLTSYMISGEGTSKNFSIIYYDEIEGTINLDDGSTATVLKILNLNINGQKIEWRSKLGHQIWKVEKDESLAFMLSEPSKKNHSVSYVFKFNK